MNIFGFRPFKGKFNLGNSDDIPENQDGTLIGSIKQIKSALADVDGYNNLLSSSYDSSKHKTYAESFGSINSTGRSITKNITLDNANVKAVYIKPYLSNNINICYVWHENTSATLSGTTLTINTTLKTGVTTNSNVWLEIEVIYA